MKTVYHNQHQKLKDMKGEIERIQNLLERCRERLQKDFDTWMAVMVQQNSNMY